MIVYRITREKYQHDISGTGSKIHGGRWNPIGMKALYASESKALSILELLVHTRKDLVPPRYKMLLIKIPYEHIEKIKGIKNLPKDWRKNPPLDELKEMGEEMLVNQNNLVIKVPSRIIPSEFNIVINPNHKDFKKVKIKDIEDFELDERLLS